MAVGTMGGPLPYLKELHDVIDAGSAFGNPSVVMHSPSCSRSRAMLAATGPLSLTEAERRHLRAFHQAIVLLGARTDGVEHFVSRVGREGDAQQLGTIFSHCEPDGERGFGCQLNDPRVGLVRNATPRKRPLMIHEKGEDTQRPAEWAPDKICRRRGRSRRIGDKGRVVVGRPSIPVEAQGTTDQSGEFASLASQELATGRGPVRDIFTAEESPKSQCVLSEAEHRSDQEPQPPLVVTDGS